METIVDDSAAAEEATQTTRGTETVIQQTPDYYAILGVARDANEEQISTAYDLISSKYNPEQNPDEDTAKAFQSATEAYQLLVDPVNRANYDVLLAGGAAPLTSKTASTGRDFGRVFGSVVSGASGAMSGAVSGVTSFLTNAPSLVISPAEDVTESAAVICKDGGLIGGGPPADPRVTDLGWGWATEARVQHRSGSYFRLTVDQRQAENGFVLMCKSSNKDKFKLIMFNSEGEVMYQEDSMRARDNKSTQAALYFTTFQAYRLGEARSPGKPTEKEKAAPDYKPAVFSKLDEFDDCKHRIVPGQYLICVYGDNFMGKTNFRLMSILSKNESLEIPSMEEADDSLCEAKILMENLSVEYAAAKKAYDEVYQKVKAEGEKIDSLINSREKAYNAFLNESIAANSIPTAGAGSNDLAEKATSPAADTASTSNADDATTGKSNEDSTEGVSIASNASKAALASITSAASVGLSTASSTASSAANKAVAAGGWFARRVSLGAESISSFVSRSRNSSVVAHDDDETAATADSAVSVSDVAPAPAEPAVVSTSSESSTPAADESTTDASAGVVTLNEEASETAGADDNADTDADDTDAADDGEIADAADAGPEAKAASDNGGGKKKGKGKKK